MSQKAAQQEFPPPLEYPPPPEPYGPPPTQQQTYGYSQVPVAPPPGDYPDEKVPFDQAFKIERPKWNDLWAGILFLLTMAGFLAVAGIAINGYAATRSSNGTGIYNDKDITINTNTLLLFVFCLCVAIVFSFLYVLLARTFTKQFIWATGILNIIWGFGTAIYMLYRKYYAGGVVFLVFGVIQIIVFISWIPRIPFSALMLRTGINVANHHGHVYLVSFIGGLIGAAYASLFAVTFVAVYVKFTPSKDNPACGTGVSGCSNAKVIGLIVFITFCAYWFSEWLKNTIHTTVSGVYGSWYFNSRAYPTGVTRGALKRSLTYSFGSISLGSLIVAIINFLRMLAQTARNQSGQQGDIVGWIFFCILGCLISVLQWVMEFVNRYAFSHIALYGRPYFQSAKDTWKMIKNRGIDTLVNECLIGPVFTFGAMFVGFATALLAYLYLEFTDPTYNSGGRYTVVIVAFAFLIGLQICNIFTTPLSSGIDTIFVAAAWDPEVMIRDHGDLYHQMVQVYPHVQEAIHA
ncbi:hypothetical protein VPNG_09853 [Cytospora leucostoma]|uniref:Protein PNS1 n=1 Tax=Cytospora leucostoma TaxID=1230097 RepID=A0A423VII2_9PEZI|nr:hypothetical protein VPNG_09853 [Cytospora leucostoma]